MITDGGSGLWSSPRRGLPAAVRTSVQPLDGAVDHPEQALDRASAMTGGQQPLDGGVLGASSAGEPDVR